MLLSRVTDSCARLKVCQLLGPEYLVPHNYPVYALCDIPSKYSVLRTIMSLLPVLAYLGMGSLQNSSDKVLRKGSIFTECLQ